MFKKVPMFTSIEEVETRSERYFKKFPHIDEAETPEEINKAKEYQTLGILPTLSGLSLAIGLKDWRDFNRYASKGKYKGVFMALKSRLLRYWETALATGRGAQGVTAWLNALTGGEMLQNQGLNDSNKMSCQIVVIGTDGNKQALSDIINATQAQRIQGTKTIDTTAQTIDRKQPAKALPTPAKKSPNPKPHKARTGKK